LGIRNFQCSYQSILKLFNNMMDWQSIQGNKSGCPGQVDFPGRPGKLLFILTCLMGKGSGKSSVPTKLKKTVIEVRLVQCKQHFEN